MSVIRFESRAFSLSDSMLESLRLWIGQKVLCFHAGKMKMMSMVSSDLADLESGRESSEKLIMYSQNFISECDWSFAVPTSKLKRVVRLDSQTLELELASEFGCRPFILRANPRDVECFLQMVQKVQVNTESRFESGKGVPHPMIGYMKAA